MIMSSIGQSNNATARMIYKMAGRTADSMVKAGKITAAERNVFWAKTVARNLMELNLQVPKAIAEQTGIETAKTAATNRLSKKQAEVQLPRLLPLPPRFRLLKQQKAYFVGGCQLRLHASPSRVL